MDWKNFITSISESKISSSVPHQILKELFDAAGSKTDISESTFKSWLNGSRNCKVCTYFPDSNVNTEKLFDYFKNRPESKIRNLQQIFLNAGVLDNDSPIDVETNDLDTFCWSLVNQFLDLLGLQRVNIGSLAAKSKTKAAQNSHLIMNSSNITTSDKIPTVLTSSISSAKPKHIPVQRPPIKALFSPHSVDCCYHCIYWQGNRKIIGAYFTPTYGYCLKYNKENQLSSSSPCGEFKKREKQLGEW